MLSRRHFSALLGLSLVGTRYSNCSSTQTNSTHQGNVIISTWNNQEANQLAYETLKKDKSDLLGAVEKAINLVEANENDMSVGYGGRPDREGQVTLDACIMDKDGNAGSVTYLKGIMHPISVARKVMEKTPHVILSGSGAQQFAEEEGFQAIDLLTEQSKEEYREWLINKEYKPKANIEMHDTIGLLVRNSDGDLTGGCSTSGMAYKMNGRVGDSPIIGAGLFVDNEVGSATATGVGELVLKTCATFLTVEFMRSGMSPQAACEAAAKRIIAKCKVADIQVGLIAMNKKGEIGAYSIQSGFVYTVTDQNGTRTKQVESYFRKS